MVPDIPIDSSFTLPSAQELAIPWVQEGVPFTGARGNALLLASMPLTAICHECGAIIEAVLEEFAGGPALVKTLQSPDRCKRFEWASGAGRGRRG